MLPTKGYFQDIECPFFNDSCGRPYCHFRHKRKPNESEDDSVEETCTGQNTVPTYKPTPKSELANNKSHIPISYVPDLALNHHQRSTRTLPRIEKPTYKPTPLSILSSANKSRQGNLKTVNEELEADENNTYDPVKSTISYDNLLSETTINDEIESEANDSIAKSSPPQRLVSENLIKIESDIEKEQTKLELLESGLNDTDKLSKSQDSGKENVKHITKARSNKPHSKDISALRKDKHSEKNRKHSEEVERKKIKKDSNKDSAEQEKNEKSTSKQHKSTNDNNKSKKEENKGDSEKKINKNKAVKADTDRNRTRGTEKKKEKNTSTRHRSRSRNKVKGKKHSKSRSRSRHRSQSRDRHKEKKKDKTKEKDNKKKKDKTNIKDNKSKKVESTAIESFGDSNYCTDTELSPGLLSDIDDLDDEDETLKECYKIFTEYKPTPKDELNNPQLACPMKDTNDDQSYIGKQRIAHEGAHNPVGLKSSAISKVKPLLTPGQALENRYKIAKMALANREQQDIINEMKNMVNTKQTPSIWKPIKRPPSLLEIGRLKKLKKTQQQQQHEQELNDIKPSLNVVDDIINGSPTISTTSNITPIKLTPKKIAAVSNVALIQKAKERISLIHQHRQKMPPIKTIAHVQKGNRVAHIPEYSLAEIPDVLQADKSKLPVNVRTRFLSLMAEECMKLYELRDDAYTRALNEEYLCYEKCKVLTIYRNSAMLAVNRLRKEQQDRQSKGLGLILSGENSLNNKSLNLKGPQFHEFVKKWILTEQDLDVHGYPRESAKKGIAKINNCKKIDFSMNDDDSWRTCARCSKKYQVDKNGWQLIEEDCTYHPLKKRTLNGVQVHLCCKTSGDIGCVTSDWHVFDGTERHLIEGYQTTLPAEMENDPRSSSIYALDCEMCYTTKGLELTRITIVDTDCKTVYESLVKPLNPIVDYNTRFSGITKDQMDRTSTSILQVQANILHLCNSQTILVGHSLESDLKALKIIHRSIIDTAVLFPHKMGLPHKRALKSLATEYLKKIIQNDASGHDSAEDAITCMELIKWKFKEELKVRGK